MMLSARQKIVGRLFMLASALVRRITLGVRVMATEDGKVLLVRHRSMGGWYFPGGGVEPGETAAMSAARELVEETGFRTAGRLRLFGFYHNVSAVSRRDHVALYVAEKVVEDHPFKPGFEIAEARWFRLDALPEDIQPGTLRRIREVLDGREADVSW